MAKHRPRLNMFGRQLLVRRILEEGRPVAMVAYELGVSRAAGRTSAPPTSPSHRLLRRKAWPARRSTRRTDRRSPPSPVGTLDSARKVVQANAGYGEGTYTQDLGVSLLIPAQSRAGTYTGTLTTTISAAP
ncbi:hypothetical protein BH20CHL6_BH20CHL6_15370 [soil metagenome]